MTPSGPECRHSVASAPNTQYTRQRGGSGLQQVGKQQKAAELWKCVRARVGAPGADCDAGREQPNSFTQNIRTP